MKKSIASLLTGIALVSFFTYSGSLAVTFAHQKPKVLLAQSNSEIELTDIKGFKGVITSLNVTPDGQTLIVASNDGQITAINLNDLESIYSLSARVNPYSNIAFSSDGSFFATADERLVIVYETQTGQVVRSLSSHRGNVSSVAISPDNRLLISASGQDLTVKIWDLQTGSLIKDIGEDINSVSTVAFNPTGEFFATGSGGIGSDRKVKYWDAENYELIKTLPKQFGFIYDLKFNSEGDKLIGAVKNYVKVWDLNRDSAELLSIKASPLDINRVAISPDSRLIATANREGKITLIDMNRRRIVASLTGHEGWIQTINFSPDSQTLYSGAEDKIVKIWDLSQL